MKVIRRNGNLFRRMVFVLLMISLLTATMSTAVFAAPESEEIGKKIEAFVAAHEETTAAMAVTVFDADHILYQNSFGYINVENSVPVTDESVFEWGSATKTLVWISAMQLWEQGKLSLETDIREYLPEGFLTNLRFEEPVTMLHLMNHTAGFQEELADIFLMNSARVLELGEQLKLHEPPQIYEPGTYMAYSNWGVALAGYIVECISGQRFDDYVHEHIFDRLGMKNTAIRPDLSDNPSVAARREELHCYSANGKPLGVINYAVSLYPCGRCTGTVSDFATYAQALLKREPGVLFEKESTWDTLFTPTATLLGTDIPRVWHGFLNGGNGNAGFAVETIGHGGNSRGCSTNLVISLDEGIGAVVMTNQRYEGIYCYQMLAEVLFGSFTDSPYCDLDKPVVGSFFRETQTVLQGPFSIYYKYLSSLLNLNLIDNVNENVLWSYSVRNDTETLSFSGIDAVRIPTGELVLSVIAMLLAVIGVCYALIVCLLGGCIARPIAARRRKKRGETLVKTLLTRMNYSACGLILLWAVNVVLIPTFALGIYMPGSGYGWLIALHGVIGLAMIALTVCMLLRMRKDKPSKAKKVEYIATCIFQAVIVFAILYWDMYQFWAI